MLPTAMREINWLSIIPHYINNLKHDKHNFLRVTHDNRIYFKPSNTPSLIFNSFESLSVYVM